MVIRSGVDNILIATNGTNGQPGTPGTSSYIHIKYSNDGGITFTSNNGETIGAYIGIYRDYTEQDSSSVSAYQWKKIEGEDGEPAYTVMLSNENFSISTDTSYVPIHTQSFTCNVTVLKGGSPESFTITASTDTENDIVTTISGHAVNITVAPVEALSATQGVITLTISTTDGHSFTKDITWSVATQGRDGQSGASGVSINDVVNYYLITIDDTPVTKQDSGWSTTIQSMTEHYPYLWNYEVIIGSDGSTISSTDPMIIGRYGRDGEAAAEGRGILSIAEHYQVSSSNTTPPTTWSNTPVVTDNTNKYLWNYETITYTDNTTEDTQKRVIGTHGTPGASGTSITISSTSVKYAISASATQAPTEESEWGTTVKTTTVEKQYLWTRTIVTYSDNTSTTSYSVARQGIDGTNGSDGRPGKDGTNGTSTYVHIKYSAVANPTDSDLTENPSDYIGICHDSNISDPTTASSYTWSKWQGHDGQNGQPGAKGEDGTNSYVHFAYSTSSDGSQNFSTTSFDGAVYIGILVDDVLEDSLDYEDYEWSLIKGADGTSVEITSTSVQYAIGVDGTTVPGSSEWGNIRQATSEKQYLWTRTIVNYSDNTQTTSYSVARQGLDGTNGEDGQPGTNGRDGTSTYVHIKYSAVGNPTDADLTETPSDYIGICHDSNVNDPATASSYAWSKWIGEDGADGKPGKDGVNGTSSYTHFAYANSADGSEDFSTSSFLNAKYIGIRVDDVQADSTNYLDYTWNLIKGADGEDGVSVTVSSTQYQSGTSNTTPPTGSWSNSPVAVSAGNYLWTKVTYSDGKTAYSVARQGINGTSVTVSNVEYAYQLSTSGTTIPTGTWQTTPQAPTITQYAWTRTTTTFSDGSTAVTYTVGGKVGQTGSKGDDGRGIVSITEYFLLSDKGNSSQITFPEQNNKHGWTTVGEALIWSKTQPYLWHCTEVVYENADGTRDYEYIDKYCDTGWKAADLVQANLTDFQQGVDNVIDRDNQAIRSAVWENTYTYKPKKDTQGNYMYDGNGKIIPDVDTATKMSSYMAEQILNMEGITSRVTSSESDIDGIDGRLSTAESTITQHATDIEAKVSKDGVIAAINLSTETEGGSTAKISADKVEINGTAIFNSISDDVNSAIEGKGYATTAQAQGYANTAEQNAIAEIPTDISELNNDVGYQTASDVSGAIVSTTTLYYASNSTTPPNKPTAHVTTNSTSTRGAWNIALPSYNASYPYLYICTEVKTKGDSYYWTSVEQTAYASAISSIKSTADAASPKSSAIARSQRIYYRKTTSGAPNKNTTWLASSGTGYGNWSLSVPQLTDSNGTKYLYLYTAVQTQTVAQQAAGNACTCSDVLIDDTATIIDGGTIITGTVTAREITADNLQGDHGWINLKDGKFYYGDESTFAASDNAISWNGSKLQIKADEFLLASGKSIFDEIEAIETWFYATAPTTSNAPASSWTTDNLKEMHLRDIYFDTNSGKSYRWAKEGSTYKWVEIEDKELSAVAGRLATAETNIQTNSEQIALRATKEELDSNYYTKTQTDSAITQKAGEIALNVTETKIAEIDIGGRNLLLKTAEAHTSAGSANGNVYITSYAQSDYLASAELVVNETVFALSFDYEVVGNTAENACFWPQFHGSAPTEANTIYSNTNHQDTSKVNMYVNDNPSGHYVIIFKVSSSQISGSANSNRVRLRNATDGSTIKISNLKLELGNIATDWSPAPEDLESYVDTAIVTAKAEIKLTTDEIESEVSKKVGDDEVISKINQSAETVKIQASKVEIDGTAIFNDSDFKEAADAAYDAKGSADKANSREQLIYISKVANTTSIGANKTWVMDTTGNQNVWTTKRPEYSQDYPVLFVATQRQTVAQSSGTTCTCTTPVIDDTITVIDGGKIITGTVEANKLDADSINASKILTVGAFKTDEQANILNSNIAVPTVNLLPSIYYREYVGGKKWTSNGITFVVNNDGSVTASGTATADASYTLNEYKDSYAVPIMHIDNSKNYTLSGCPSGGSSTTYCLRGCCRADATSGTASNNYYDYGNGRTFKPGTEWIGFYIVIKKNYAIPEGGLTFYPQFEVGETANPYISTHQGSGALRDTIDNIQVGGRNLLRHTKDFAESTYTSTCTFEKDAEGITVITFPAYTGSVGWKGCTFHPNIPYTLIRNKTVTLSFWYRSDSWTLASGGHDYPLPSFEILETATSNPSGTDRLKYVTIYDTTVPAPTTEWQQFVRTYNITDSFFTAGSGTVTVDKYFTIQFFQHNLSHLQYKKFKLEIGNKATDWSPAPEDVEDNINNLGLSGKNLLTGTNTVTTLTSTGTWANRTWRKGGSATGTIAHIDVTDAPYSFITNGWQFDVTSVTDDADAHALLIAQNGVHVTGGKTYTMSCYARGTGKLYMFLGINSYTPAKAKQFTVTSGWQKYSHVITMPTGTGYVNDNGSNAFFGASVNDTSIQICGMMLEEGDTATLWSPAPEDITSEEQRIYYRSSVSTKPNGNGLPTTWVTENTNKWNSVATNADGWSRKVTPISQNENDTDKYLYLYTCTQSRSVSGNVTYSEILLDDSTTVIDGGKIITGTVDTNQLNANAVTAEKIAVNAVTAEKIEAHSISANHLNIGDNTNLAQANENIPNSLPGRVWNGTSYNEDGTSYNNNYKLNIQDGYLVKKSATQTCMMFTDFVPSSFRTGDELYYEFYAKAASATTISVNCWGYTEKYTGFVCSDYITGINLTTDEQLISGTIQLTKEEWNTTAKYYLLGLNNNASTKVQISVRKVIFRKKNGGELIIDGSLRVENFTSDTQEKVLNSTIQVGGRNLLYDANAPSLVPTGPGGGNRYYSNARTIPTNGEGTEWTLLPDQPIPDIQYGMKHVCTQTGGQNHCISFYNGADRIPFIPGCQYTISYWAKSDVQDAIVIIGLSSNDEWDRTSAYYHTIESINTWERVSVTFTYLGTDDLTPYNKQNTILYMGFNYNVVGTVWCCGYQVEVGNMATNWSEYSYTQTSFGGRNLIRNTNIIDLGSNATKPNINGYYNDGNHYGNVETSGGTLSAVEHGVKITATGNASYALRFGTATTNATNILKADGLYGLEAGATYTLSFDTTCKIASAYTGSGMSYLGVYLYGDIKGDGTLGNENTWNIEWFSYPIQFYPWEKGTEKEGIEKEGHVVFTFTIPNDATRIYLSIRPGDNNASYAGAGDFIEMRNIKLERGNHATDYSPASEDIGLQFDEVNSRVDTLDEFQSGARGWMEFKDAELTIGKKIEGNDDIFTTVIDGTQMAFKQNDETVAYISNKELAITDANIKNNLIIGKFIFRPHESNDGGMSLIWS